MAFPLSDGPASVNSVIHMKADSRDLSEKNRLPDKMPEPEVSDVIADVARLNEDPINILLVDDEPRNLEALETVLDNPGYRLVRATSADEALLAILAEEFALMILDIQMPGMNGFELAQMIKGRKKTAGVPIIFLTAYYSEDQHVLEGYSTGAVDYLHKPINAMVLQSKVAVFAELHRKTRETTLTNRALMAEISERRLAQEQLRELNETLDQRVRERTEELRESETRFRMMANAMSQLAWMARPDGSVFWYNERWYDYTGTTLRQMEGSGWQSVLDPMALPEVLARWKACVATGEPFEMTFPLRGADGLYRLFLTRGIPLKDAEGRVWQWFGTNTDIDELKRTEAALAARTAELMQADRNKDEFLAMLAHELRNPLAPLRSAAEVLKMADASSEESRQSQRILSRQIENMTRMIDDLLDVSRITEGRIELRRQPVALEAILTAAASLVRSSCAAHGQKLELFLPDEPVFLEADATRLEQIFGNLLTNACKYSGEGANIWLSAERAAGTDPPEVIIRVRDNGIGIAPELLPCIFDLFVQASRSLDRSHGGLGIGLTLVQRLVKLHGGSIEAHSEGPGKGSEFVVHLPMLKEAPPQVSPPSPAVISESPKRILIVDDNTDSASSMAMFQSHRGHETRTAFTGPDAVAAAAEFLPDIVLLDIGLPGMDGFEVARRLRAMPGLAGVFIIAMSGYGREEDRVEADLAGFDDYLVKPLDLDYLRELLRKRV